MTFKCTLIIGTCTRTIVQRVVNLLLRFPIICNACITYTFIILKYVLLNMLCNHKTRYKRRAISCYVLVVVVFLDERNHCGIVSFPKKRFLNVVIYLIVTVYV